MCSHPRAFALASPSFWNHLPSAILRVHDLRFLLRLSSSLWWVYLKFYFPLTPSFSWKCESESPSVVSNSLWPHGLYSPWNSLGQRTGAGSRSLLQGISPTQGSNPGLLHCRWILYQLSHKGSPPRKLGVQGWTKIPTSRGSKKRNLSVWPLLSR